MKLRKNEPVIVKSEMPHYYELKFNNHPNGLEKVHCGTMKDVERMLEIYPDAIYSKILLPHPPQTVEVHAKSIEEPVALPTLRIEGQEIPMQQNLPQSELKELEL
tara:strand:- start:294 stop:608 length:315 start_codon:yes stop_codon:yes gene_type:complete